MDDEDIRIAVFAKLNKLIGDDINNLEKCYDLQDDLLKTKETIEKLLSLASSEAPSKIKEALETAEETCNAIREKRTQVQSLLQEANKKLEENKDVSEHLAEKMEHIRLLKCAVEYMNIVEDIENISRELEPALTEKEESIIVQLFVSLKSIANRLQNCKAPHLQKFAKDTIQYWHDLLVERFDKDFDACMKAVKWPLVGNNVTATGVIVAESLSKFQTVIEYLLQIQIEEEEGDDDKELCLPVKCLVKPLRKRFMFHFYGQRQTNRLDKPEWYLTQVLTWIKSHEEFLEQNVQPVFDKTGYSHIDAKAEFAKGIVKLAVGKLHSDLDRITVHQEDLFAHLVDECLGFHKELAIILNDNPTVADDDIDAMSVLAVLTQGVYFTRWLAMEKKYATEKVDIMLSLNTDDAWQPLNPHEAEDDTACPLKATKLADNFLSLLHSIRERYEMLRQPGHRLQFLDLQLELIDDLRVRLMQLSHEQLDACADDIAKCIESKSRLPQILNTVHYIVKVLTEWGCDIHYLQLHYFKCQMNSLLAETPTTPITLTEDSLLNFEQDLCSVFHSSIELLEKFCTDHINALSDSIVLSAKAKSLEYRKDRWFAMPGPLAKEELCLSQSACSMLQVLSARLNHARISLAAPLFLAVRNRTVVLLDAFLHEELICQNKFSVGGAQQIQYDVERGLVPLFHIDNEASRSFKKLLDSCRLLNITKGSALLLQESLADPLMKEESILTLQEMNVTYFNVNAAKEILSRRMDLLIDS